MVDKDRRNVINIASIKTLKNKPLTDSDINALFLGLVRLIKKNVTLEISEDLKKDCYEANENFRQSLIDLNKTEALLKKEQEKNIKLEHKILEEEKKFCLLFEKFAKLNKAK